MPPKTLNERMGALEEAVLYIQHQIDEQRLTNDLRAKEFQKGLTVVIQRFEAIDRRMDLVLNPLVPPRSGSSLSLFGAATPASGSASSSSSFGGSSAPALFRTNSASLFGATSTAASSALGCGAPTLAASSGSTSFGTPPPLSKKMNLIVAEKEGSVDIHNLGTILIIDHGSKSGYCKAPFELFSGVHKLFDEFPQLGMKSSSTFVDPDYTSLCECPRFGLVEWPTSCGPGLRDKRWRHIMVDRHKLRFMGCSILLAMAKNTHDFMPLVDMEVKLKSEPDKHLVLLRSKIDLVPWEDAEDWLKYRREELPTVAFKCNTQQQRSNSGWKSSKKSAKASTLLQTSDCLGAETLIKLLKNYSRSHEIKTSITVGVNGLPNVGKSSLINSLKRSHVVNVGATSELTRSMQEVQLDKNVKLLDCPLVVIFRPEENDASIALRSCKRIEKLDDPLGPMKEILKLCPARLLVTLYKIPSFYLVNDYLQKVATVRGKLTMGGLVDEEAAARIVLHNWNEGTIQYFNISPCLQLETKNPQWQRP